MALPLATTTVTILRAPVADDFAEPYSGITTVGFDEVASGVPAVIYAPVGRQAVAGGEQTVTDLQFVCDLADVRSADRLKDEATNTTYKITWCVVYAGEHIEGGLELVEGLV